MVLFEFSTSTSYHHCLVNIFNSTQSLSLRNFRMNINNNSRIRKFQVIVKKYNHTLSIV